MKALVITLFCLCVNTFTLHDTFFFPPQVNFLQKISTLTFDIVKELNTISFLCIQSSSLQQLEF